MCFIVKVTQKYFKVFCAYMFILKNERTLVFLTVNIFNKMCFIVKVTQKN